MRLFSFRMKDGNSVIIYARDRRAAEETLTEMGMQSTAASVRELTRFVNPNLFNDLVRQDAHNWSKRDKDLIAYVVQKERERFSN